MNYFKKLIKKRKDLLKLKCGEDYILNPIKRFYTKRKNVMVLTYGKDFQYRYISRIIKIIHKYEKKCKEHRHCFVKDCSSILPYKNFIVHNVKPSLKRTMIKEVKYLNSMWNLKEVKFLCCKCFEKHKDDSDLEFLYDIKNIKNEC